LIATAIGVTVTLVGIVIRVERRFGNMERRLFTLETKIEPFWDIVKSNLPKLFSSNPNRELLKKLQAGKLTHKEAHKLKCELEEEMEKKPRSQRANYLLALWLLEGSVEHK